MIEYECPHCAKVLNIQDQYAGYGGNCNYCKGKVVVPGGAILTLPGGLMMEFVRVPEGSFQMGVQTDPAVMERLMNMTEAEKERIFHSVMSEMTKPLPERRPGWHTNRVDDPFENARQPHEVKFSRPFFLGKFPVTQAQWCAIMGLEPPASSEALIPKTNLSRTSLQQFFTRLNTMTQGVFRLPSESEWEYACRAGSTTHYCYGDAEELLGEYAWFGASNPACRPVGQKKPNLWGLYDMHGNVQELCADHYSGRYRYAPVDGSPLIWRSFMQEEPGHTNKWEFVIRGGGSSDKADNCRSGFRSWCHLSPTTGDICSSSMSLVGFRVASFKPIGDSSGGKCHP